MRKANTQPNQRRKLCPVFTKSFLKLVGCRLSTLFCWRRLNHNRGSRRFALTPDKLLFHYLLLRHRLIGGRGVLYPKCLLLVLACLFVNNCTKNNVSQQPLSRIAASPSAPSLACWYVQGDSRDVYGYAAADSRISYPPPTGGGLFASLQELKQAIRRQETTSPQIIGEYPCAPPEGWIIRKLTREELTVLSSK